MLSEVRWPAWDHGLTAALQVVQGEVACFQALVGHGRALEFGHGADRVHQALMGLGFDAGDVHAEQSAVEVVEGAAGQFAVPVVPRHLNIHAWTCRSIVLDDV